MSRLHELYNLKRITRAILGSVLIVNDHGLMLDYETPFFTITHMDPDGKVVSKTKHPTISDAALAMVTLKRSLEKTTLFMPDRKYLQ